MMLKKSTAILSAEEPSAYMTTGLCVDEREVQPVLRQIEPDTSKNNKHVTTLQSLNTRARKSRKRVD